MSKKLSLKEALARPDAAKEKLRARSASRAVKTLLSAGAISRPVELIRTLARYGLSLRRAHDVVDRLARGETVADEFVSEDEAYLVWELAGLGVRAALIRAPSANAKSVREGFGLSQDEFATHFGLEPSTVRNWEQGRNKPDPAAQLLLKIIETEPQAVERALTGQSVPNQDQSEVRARIDAATRNLSPQQRSYLAEWSEQISKHGPKPNTPVPEAIAAIFSSVLGGQDSARVARRNIPLDAKKSSR